MIMAGAIAICGLILSGLVMAFCRLSAVAESCERQAMAQPSGGNGRLWCRECCEFVEVHPLHGEYVTSIVCNQCGDSIDLMVHPQ